MNKAIIFLIIIFKKQYCINTISIITFALFFVSFFILTNLYTELLLSIY